VQHKPAVASASPLSGLRRRRGHIERPTVKPRLSGRLGFLRLFVVLLTFAAACGPFVGSAVPSHGPNGVSHGSLVSDGRAGTYRLFRPPNLDPNRPAPLLLVLHGSSFAGDKMASLGSWDAKATIGGFIAAFPDWGWDPFQAPPNPDVTLISGLIDRLENQLTIDE